MLKNLSIKYKNWLLVTLASLMAVVTIYLALSLTLDSVLHERRLMAKSLTEMAYNIIDRKYQFFLEGKLKTEEDAKKSAISALRSMTYGENGYYFIYERNGTAVMVPSKPQLEGQNKIGITDPNGIKVVEELAKVSANGQGGFVSYHWNRPGHDEPQAKVSYAKGFKQWDWFVGTGNYESEMKAEVISLVKRELPVLVLSMLFFITLITVLFVINRNTLKQVLSLKKHLTYFADGNFSHKIPSEGKDEFGQMFNSMKQVQVSMKKTIGQLGQTVDTVRSGVVEIASSNQNLATRTEEQAANLARSSHNLTQVAGMVRTNSNSLAEANDLAKRSQDTVVRGEQVVQEAIGAMSRITTSSNKVTEIINVIDEIAFQTNLLALNAAVEAARAGDQGRGFAVVAAEVRTLAQRSATSANEIKSLIEESAQNVKTGSELVSASGDLLKEILESSHQVGTLMGGIATSTQEQTQSIETTSQAVGEVDTFVQENAAMVQEVAVSGESLKHEVESLQELVKYFDIGGAGGSHRASHATDYSSAASASSGFSSGAATASFAPAGSSFANS